MTKASTTYAVASAGLDSPMESGVAVFTDSDPYTPIAEDNFHMETVNLTLVRLRLSWLGFYAVGDWRRDPAGYLVATVRRLATRHECVSRYERVAIHDRGAGQPRRKRTKCCGAEYRVSTGLYGLFFHSSVSGSNAYRYEDALSLHRTEKAAERAARASGPSLDQLAVRWIAMGGQV